MKRERDREMTKDKVIRGPSRGTHLVVIRIEGTGYLVTTNYYSSTVGDHVSIRGRKRNLHQLTK